MKTTYIVILALLLTASYAFADAVRCSPLEKAPQGYRNTYNGWCVRMPPKPDKNTPPGTPIRAAPNERCPDGYINDYRGWCIPYK